MRFIPPTIKRRLWRFLTGRMHLRWPLRSGLTAQVRDFADWCTYNEIFVSGEYESALSRLEASAAPGAPVHVLDLGANTGFFALYAMDRWLRRPGAGGFHYAGVEAAPETARDLAGRLAQCEARGIAVQVVAGLVGERAGTGQLRMGRESNLNSAQAPAPGSEGAWTVGRGVQSVPWVDLAPIVDKWPRLDLVKCDIEGSEFAFLRNYPELLSRTRLLVIEFHHAFGSTEAASEALRAMGWEEVERVREAQDVRVALFENRRI